MRIRSSKHYLLTYGIVLLYLALIKLIMSCEVNGTQKIPIELSKYEKSKKTMILLLAEKLLTSV